jgi:DNA end-binding protein Ku
MASTVWRGYITFGLISIPVRLFRAARAERLSFRRLYRADPAGEMPMAGGRGQAAAAVEPARETAAKGLRALRRGEERETVETPERVLTPLQQVSVKKGSGEVVEEPSVVKGYEYEKDRFVVVEREELKSAAAKTSTQMEIEEFVQLAEIDPVYFETSYYVTPEEAGEKAYALLKQALEKTGLVALAQFAMHNREHVVVLRPGKTGIIAHTMFFASEVRAEEEYRADASAVGEKELELAERLIHSLKAPFEPGKYRDKYRERLESILAKKVQGQPVERVETVAKPAEVVDIADALRRSLASLKKPAGSEEEGRQTQGEARGKKARGAGRK